MKTQTSSLSKIIRIASMITFLVTSTYMPADKSYAQEREAAPSQPGWHLMTNEEAKARVEKIKDIPLVQQEETMMQETGFMLTMNEQTDNISPGAYPMINELARSLEYDPKKIYDYVHNHIDFAPYYGVRRGLEATVLQRAGSDAEQVLLMQELLRISGYSAEIIIADIDYFDKVEMQRWLGVNSSFNWREMSRIFSSSGAEGNYYINSSQEQVGLRTRRFVLKSNIDGQDCYFDPAFKQHEPKTEIDFASALGYSRDDLITSASEGASIGADYVQYINEVNVRQKLREYSENLINYLNANYSNEKTSRLFGRGAIVPTTLESFQTEIPSDWTIISTGTGIPDELVATFNVEFEGINQEFDLMEIIGKRLTVTFNSGNQPELRLDGVLKATGNGLTQGQNYSLSMAVTHPGSEPHMQTASLECGDNTYAIASHVGMTKDALAAYRQNLLAQYQAQGLAPDSEQVRGEILNIIGLMYYQKGALTDRLMEVVSDAFLMYEHGFGVIAQEGSYSVDLPLNMMSSRTADEDPSSSVFYTTNMLYSAYEHGVLEEMMGTEVPGVSTVKLLQLASARGDKIFWAHAGNFSNIQSQLQNYHPQTLSRIEQNINSGGNTILPQDGLITLNDWQGLGYLTNYNDGALGMIISGGLNGGFGTIQADVTSEKTNSYLNFAFPKPNQITSIHTPTSSDPVNMTTGAFLYNKNDVDMGADVSNVSFQRAYSSDRKFTKKNMGYGWTHNYDINVLKTSDMNSALGSRNPTEAAAVVTVLYAARDLYKNNAGLLEHMIIMLGYKWLVDQMLDNAYTIEAGDQLMKYIKLPDGSFSPPEGQTADLVKNADGTFKLVERFGTEMRFNTDDKIQSIVDNKGNTTTFSYSGGKLQTVADDYGHSLTLGYNGDNIETVTDSAGRSATYHYDANGDMDQYTDVDGKTWSFGYDDHKMTTLTNPLGITTATNVYDDLGRVKTQTVPRQTGTATYNFYFSGYRNLEEDPFGRKKIYYIDHKGRTYAVENEQGHKTVKKFDGQNHEIEVTGPRGYTTLFDYNGDQNLEAVTNALAQVTRYRYDAHLRLDEVEDPLNHITQYDYYTDHLLQKVTDPEGNTVEKTYYPNGQLQTTTDARSTLSTMTYDAWGNPETSTTGSHPSLVYDYDQIGRMETLTDQEGATTTFEYTNSGKVKKRIDPLTKQEQYFYDDAGRLETYIDRNNDTISYDYTDSGKLETVTYPDTSTVSYTYDQHDILKTAANTLGTTTYGHNGLYQVTSVNDALGYDIGYDYDAAGNVTGITYPGGYTVTYAYDELNRLETVTNWQGQTASYHYDSAGRLDWMENFNGTVTDYDYDDANRLTFLENKTALTGGQTVSRYAYILDGNGNREQVTQLEPLAPVLTNIDISFGYNAVRNRLLSAGSIAFGYDDEGQLSTRGGRAYDFDYDHRLVTISGADTAQFYYDAGGNRLKAVRNGEETQYIYDLSGNLLAEADDTGTISRYYIHGLGLLAMVTPDNEVYTYHYDGNANTIALTDAAKQPVNTYAYTPYGLIAAQDEEIEQPFTFAGMVGIMEEGDPSDGGLYYMRARYYDPAVGRFISEDPSGFADGPNLYAYAGGNPVNYYDANGRWAISAITGAIGGAYSGAMTALANGGSLRAGILGGIAGGVTGAAVGWVLDDFNGTLAGAAAGGTVGGSVGGLVGNMTANAIDGKELSENAAYSAVSGAVIGGAGAAFSHVAMATGSTVGEAAIGSQVFLAPYEIGVNAIYNQHRSSMSGGYSGK
ncbi:MAG: RHS repeat domain-containing protein [Candidatus Omnitrophota bacterium]